MLRKGGIDLDFIVNRAELLTAARKAAAIAPVDSPVKELEGVLLEAEHETGSLVVSATNMELSLKQKMRCEAKEDDAVVINARLLVQMLEKLSGERVRLQRPARKPVLHVVSELTRYAVPVRERAAFPNLTFPFPEDTVQVRGIPSLARRTVFATCQDPAKPLLRCVNLMFTKNGLRTAGSDGCCVVTARGDEKSVGSVNLLIPAASLDKLARMSADADEFRVGTDGKTIVFSKEGFLFGARLMNGKYVDTDRLIAALKSPFMVYTEIEVLRRALASVTAVDPKGKVSLTFEGQKILLSCSGANGNASVSLNVVLLKGYPNGRYYFQAEQLLTCLSTLEGIVKVGVAQGSMLILLTDDAFYMQNGVRAPAAERTDEKAA